MVAVDGKFYQVKTDGKAYPVSPAQKTPFGEVTFFKAEKTLDLKPLDLPQLEKCLEPITQRQLPLCHQDYREVLPHQDQKRPPADQALSAAGWR